MDIKPQEADKGSTLVVAAPAGLSEAIQNVRTCVVQDGVLNPLEQAEKISRAIELQVPLTDLQLALLLGEDLEDVIRWKNPRTWADGIRLRPRTMHGQRRWRIERTTPTDSMDAVAKTQSMSADSVFAAGQRRGKKVGFDDGPVPRLVSGASESVPMIGISLV